MKKKKLLNIITSLLILAITTCFGILKTSPRIRNNQLKREIRNYTKDHKYLFNKSSVRSNEDLTILSANVRKGWPHFNKSVQRITEITDSNETIIICLQEAIKPYVESILNTSHNNLTAVGKYRYGSLPIPNNEATPIITNSTILDAKTFYLTWITDNYSDLIIGLKSASFYKRTAVISLVETKNNNNFYVLNTHLEYKLKSLQKIQLEQLKIIITEIPNNFPLIITGDFNQVITDPDFIDFITFLENLGIKLADNDINTFKGNKKDEERIIDYVFYRDINILNIIIIDSENESDHQYIKILAQIK